MLNEDKYIVLFDGVCNLCNKMVQYVIKRDLKDRFRFGSLQGITGFQLLEKHNLDISKTDTIVLIINNKVYLKSTAILKVMSKLKFPTNLLAFFLILPGFIRNWGYDFIAKNRYKWYGKRNSCMIPTFELKKIFLP